jgi:hypothetical protein
MVFSMRCWSSVDTRRLAFVVALLGGLCMVGEARADGYEIRVVEDRIVNGIYVVDSTIHFGLSEDMRNALDSGVSLSFLIEVEIHTPRRYMWDELVVRSAQRLTLEYHALTGGYVVNNQSTHTRRSFPSMDEALEALGDLRGMAVSEERFLPANMPFAGRLRVSLDVESLPPPLRPIAYLSPDWHLRSDWHRWTVEP